MTINEALQRLAELKNEAGDGGIFLEVRQLNGMDRAAHSMQFERSTHPEQRRVIILLQDEAAHG